MLEPGFASASAVVTIQFLQSESLLADTGYDDCDYVIEVVRRPRTQIELTVSRRGEDPSFDHCPRCSSH